MNNNIKEPGKKINNKKSLTQIIKLGKHLNKNYKQLKEIIKENFKNKKLKNLELFYLLY